AGVRKGAFLNVFDPGAKDSDRDIVLLLARYRAGMAPDTAVMIDYEAVAQLVPRLAYASMLEISEVIFLSRMPVSAVRSIFIVLSILKLFRSRQQLAGAVIAKAAARQSCTSSGAAALIAIRMPPAKDAKGVK